MRIPLLLVLSLLLLLGGACGRSDIPSASDVPNAGTPVAPPPAESAAPAAAKPQLSYLNTGDVRSKPQLISGWYSIEDAAWRWMSREARAVLLTPRESPVNFELRLFFPSEHMKRAGGPVTVSVLFDGNLFAQQKYTTPGGYTLAKPVPAGTLSSPATQVTIRLDRSVPAAGGDQRELGAVVQGLGFTK